jgi:cytochrome c biogenesis protein CcmG/thiol:disulfide interchange protein DsbE
MQRRVAGDFRAIMAALMGRTAMLVAGVVAGAVFLGLALARMAPAEDGGVPMLSSGEGVEVRFSDKPVALPAFRLVDLEGRTHSNETLAGKVVLLNFWATWCTPCREEIPMLSALQDRYRDRLVILGLSIDERPADEVKAFAATLGVTYPVVMSTREFEGEFGGINAVPSTFVVDPAGRIVQRHLGLLQGPRTEHEVRALAGLPTDADVQRVQDSGQVLLANAAYATTIPGLDLQPLTAAAREETRRRLNTETCTCGCGLTVAQCRINDPACEISLPVARKILDDVQRSVR